MTGAARPERGAVLELRELLDEIDALASEGERTRYDADRRYRWVIHRLWIAVGNEAAVLEKLPGDTSAWRALRLLRNDLAHVRLPDIDEDAVWRMTNIGTVSLRISSGRHSALIGRLRSSEMNRVLHRVPSCKISTNFSQVITVRLASTARQ